MSVAFLPSIDLSTYTSEEHGLNPKQLSYFRNVYTVLSTTAIEEAFTYLQQTVGLYDTCFNVTSLSSIDDVVSLLDSGAAQVFVSAQQLKDLQAVENVDESRLVLSVDHHTAHQLDLASEKRPIHIAKVEDAQALQESLSKRKEEQGPIYLTIDSLDGDSATLLHTINAIPILSAQSLTVDSDKEPDLVSAADVLMANAKSDRPDGLYTTLVCDERGIALGLVYSNEESVTESLKTGRGVYWSRKRGLWRKGETTGDVQELVGVAYDCDQDCLRFTVKQKGRGFCHLGTSTCFGQYKGLAKLQQTLLARKENAPKGSYTARLFNDSELLNAKIKEEAGELCEATEKDHIAFEAADVLYFTLTKCIAAGVSLEDIEANLDAKSVKVKRRKGDAKVPLKSQTNGTLSTQPPATNGTTPSRETLKEAASVPKSKDDAAGLKNNKIQMRRYDASQYSTAELEAILQRPSQKSTEMIMNIVKPIIENVRTRGDEAVLEYTHKFEKATSLTSAVLKAPFPQHMMDLPQETIDAIDVSFENIRKFHAAQKEDKPLTVETMPGVVCSRFVKPIERVGLYVPGGTAVLPSTALMLGVPAMVAGCRKLVIASPPRADGSLTPEVVYAAHKVGASEIVLAGGAQAVAAMAYGTASITKVDKILGPGNQFVTAAKMLVSNDTSAGVSIDMPAGPSEVLVVADSTSNADFVASDLLSQAEHGVDSQVILIAVGMSEPQLQAVEDALHAQASALPRVDIVRGAIDHSLTLSVPDIEAAMTLSNLYAPEHLILQNSDADLAASLVENAGSVFIGPWTPESVGDYSAGVNHSLPTYGYARQYSGVNLGSYVKHITSSKLTEQGLRNVGTAVMRLAKVEELEAHRRAVEIRLDWLDGKKEKK